ncbi:MAG: metal ABC transporter solute-binding protein, Zn/Mn family [Acidimicrobiales bacterium]
MTTNILGDVVTSLTGGVVDVVTIMPVGADPHEFQASARQADAMRSADALIVNGAGFEEGLLDVIEGAEADGVSVFEAIRAVRPIEFADDHDSATEHADEDHGDHEDEDHGDHEDEDHGDHDDAHGHDGTDPHFFTDPARMAVVVHGIADFLIDEVDGIDTVAVEAAADAYEMELEALDAEIADLLAAIPSPRRVLVTNHEVFGYFAERYGFDVVGAIIPGGSTTDGASAAALAALAETIRNTGVTVIFADVSSSTDLAQTLADEVGDIEIVELYSESLGGAGSDGATYVDMIRANAERITAALAS